MSSKRDKKPSLFFYDFTKSYLEGSHNELGALGYNRDGKKGKRQILIGLLCDENGVPLSIEVFDADSQRQKPWSSQIKKVAERAGLIKTGQMERLGEKELYYVKAIIKSLTQKLTND